MTEIKYPIEFKECPICHCTDTIGRLGTEELKEKGKIPKEAFASLEKVLTPLLSSTLVAAIPALMCHYDVCAKCGFRYCTRVDKVIGTSGPPPGGKMPGVVLKLSEDVK